MKIKTEENTMKTRVKSFRFKTQATRFISKISKVAKRLKKRIDFVISPDCKMVSFRIVK